MAYPGGKGGGRPPPNDKRVGCSKSTQMCNKIDRLEGNFEIASSIALFYLETIGKIFKRVFSQFLKSVVKEFPWGSIL